MARPLPLSAALGAWSFEALPRGRWVFSARAEAEGRSAWGRTPEVDIAPESTAIVRIFVGVHSAAAPIVFEVEPGGLPVDLATLVVRSR